MVHLTKMNHDDESVRTVYSRLLLVVDTIKCLCKCGGSIFTANLSVLENPDWSMKANCENGYCLYVDDVRGGCCIPIDKLEWIYFIKED